MEISEYDEDYGGKDRRKRGRYSPVITLGNILTILLMMGSIVSLWVNMNARLSVVENNQINARMNNEHRDAESAQLRRDWQDSIRDLHSDLTHQSDKLDRLMEIVTTKDHK